MKSPRRRTAREEAARKAWLDQAAKWDGIAHAWHPGLRRMINMDWYKETGAERIMARLDSLPPLVRQAVYNGPDGDIDRAIVRVRIGR